MRLSQEDSVCSRNGDAVHPALSPPEGVTGGESPAEFPLVSAARANGSMTGRCGSRSRMAGRGRFWCGAVSKNSPSTPTISVTLPPGKTRWRRLSKWPDNAGKSRNALRLPRANADWITTRFANWQGWYRHITLAMLAHAVLSVLRARGEKNSKRASAAQRTRTAPSAHRIAMARVARH